MAKIKRPFGRKASATVPAQRGLPAAEGPMEPGAGSPPVLPMGPSLGQPSGGSRNPRRLGRLPLIGIAATLVLGGAGSGYLLLSSSSGDVVDGSQPVRPPAPHGVTATKHSPSGSPSSADPTSTRNPFGAGGTSSPTGAATGDPTGAATSGAPTSAAAPVTVTALTTVSATVRTTVTATATSTVNSTVTVTVTPGP